MEQVLNPVRVDKSTHDWFHHRRIEALVAVVKDVVHEIIASDDSALFYLGVQLDEIDNDSLGRVIAVDVDQVEFGVGDPLSDFQRRSPEHLDTVFCECEFLHGQFIDEVELFVAHICRLVPITEVAPRIHQIVLLDVGTVQQDLLGEVSLPDPDLRDGDLSIPRNSIDQFNPQRNAILGLRPGVRFEYRLDVTQFVAGPLLGIRNLTHQQAHCYNHNLDSSNSHSDIL